MTANWSTEADLIPDSDDRLPLYPELRIYSGMQIWIIWSIQMSQPALITSKVLEAVMPVAGLLIG